MQNQIDDLTDQLFEEKSRNATQQNSGASTPMQRDFHMSELQSESEDFGVKIQLVQA